MDLQKNIRERCHVNKNDEGDSFVGVKADTDDAVIYFPIGYQLPPNDDDGKVYVLDAKLYRYGYSGNPDHLPNGPDINKQITYGEYIERAKGVPSEILYNAFIMPFNREDNTFFEMGADGNPIPRVTDNIGNIGEAVGDWKPEPKNYERVQGIVIDTRFLMYNYIGMPDQQKRQLAEAIEKVETRAPVPRPAT